MLGQCVSISCMIPIPEMESHQVIVSQPSVENHPAPIIMDMLNTDICSSPDLVHQSSILNVSEALSNPRRGQVTTQVTVELNMAP